AVFVFNQRAYVDVLIAASLVRTDFTVADQPLAANPLVSTIARIAGGASGPPETLTDAVKKRRVSVLAAPEGPGAPGERVGPFEEGPFRMAMEADVPVVPIVIRNGDVLGPRHARVLRPGTVDVAVLPPIDVSTWTARNLATRVAAVRQTFVETLNDWPPA